MSHFAEINSEGVVQRVIVAEQDFINSGAVGNSSSWVQTSYNTKGGKHYDQAEAEDAGVALRYNYAGVGDTYDSTRDAFIAPQPFPSWTLVEASCLWEAPVAHPDDDKMYTWDEDVTNWVEVTE
jgi:hypothetical protein